MVTTRDIPRSQAIEDYAKAIFALESKSGEPVSTNALAERLSLTAGSVSAMLKRLDELGVMRHPRLLGLFLSEMLNMPWDRVHAEAEVLEHVLSEDLEELIAAKLGNPPHPPHGAPIPGAEFELDEPASESLDDLPAGA